MMIWLRLQQPRLKVGPGTVIAGDWQADDLQPSKADRIRKTLLELCCSDEAARILNEDPNSLCNLLLLAPSQHRLFGQFNLALDAVHVSPASFRSR